MKENRLKEIYDLTIDSDLVCDYNLKNIDFYTLLCKAASKNKLFKHRGNNVCMFKYKHIEDSVLMIFSIPINSSEETGSKHIVERIMNIIEDVEKQFITLEYVNSIEVKEDKFVYITCIKKRVY